MASSQPHNRSSLERLASNSWWLSLGLRGSLRATYFFLLPRFMPLAEKAGSTSDVLLFPFSRCEPQESMLLLSFASFPGRVDRHREFLPRAGARAKNVTRSRIPMQFEKS
jgi:hypothetical protein